MNPMNRPVYLPLVMLACLSGLRLPTAVAQNVQSVPQPPGQQATPETYRPENDPAFKRLSPEGQEWVRKMDDRLDTALAHRDIDGLDQLTLDVAQKEIAGAKFCGHVFGQGMFLDAIATDGPANEQAFVARWLEPARGSEVVHTAVFTGKRCSATDGNILDGMSIVRILPNSLAISTQHGIVAYEALYIDKGDRATKALHRGIFIENAFLVELDPSKASALIGPLKDEDRDFTWSHEKETLVMRKGVFMKPAASAIPAIH